MSYDPVSIRAADCPVIVETVAPEDSFGRLLKIKDVCQDLSLSRATIYRLMKDPENPFPQPVKNRNGLTLVEMRYHRVETKTRRQ